MDELQPLLFDFATSIKSGHEPRNLHIYTLPSRFQLRMSGLWVALLLCEEHLFADLIIAYVVLFFNSFYGAFHVTIEGILAFCAR